MENILYKEESYKIIGLCMEVFNHLGSGFSEIVYKDALEYELRRNNIHFEREKEYRVEYKDIILPHYFCMDFVVMDKIVLEPKTVTELKKTHLEQTTNYLYVSGLDLGILVNFRGEKLQYQRIALTEKVRKYQTLANTDR